MCVRYVAYKKGQETMKSTHVLPAEVVGMLFGYERQCNQRAARRRRQKRRYDSCFDLHS